MRPARRLEAARGAGAGAAPGTGSAGGSRAARRRPGAGYERIKRMLDVVGAAVGLLLSAPVLLLVAVVVAGTLGRPVLFHQWRPGRHGVPFRLVKFRTMHPTDPARGLVSDAQRLNGVGAWLRAASLDELPTLINVLRGEMSLVGPRPLLTSYLGRYTPEQARRHEVRPGITGLAQVRGRNALDWPVRLAMDTWYVDHRSLRLDLSILLATIRVVVRRDGVRAAGECAAADFLGTPPSAIAQEGRR